MHTLEPLSTNFNRTPVYTKENAGAIKAISIPLPSNLPSIDVAWSSNAIGDIAKREGIEEICFADLETLSILRIPFITPSGLWSNYTVHVYGKPGPQPPTTPAPESQKPAEPQK